MNIRKDSPLLRWMRAHDACAPAIAWVASCTNDREAWNMCEHGAWLLWLAARLERPPILEKLGALVVKNPVSMDAANSFRSIVSWGIVAVRIGQ